MPDLTIGTVALVPIIVALVEAAKAAGLNVKYAPWLNAGLSVGGYSLILWVSEHPESMPTVTIGLNMLLVFLSAAGLYNFGTKAVYKVFGISRK